MSSNFERLHEIKKKHMLKISAVYLIGKAEIPIHYITWGQVEQALLFWNYLTFRIDDEFIER